MHEFEAAAIDLVDKYCTAGCLFWLSVSRPVADFRKMWFDYTTVALLCERNITNHTWC